MLHALLAYLMGIAVWAADPLAGHAAAVPGCPSAVRHCFSLDVRVVVDGEQPVATPPWLADQVREANRLFAVIDVGFEVSRVRPLEAKWARLETRLQRDELGRRPRTPGVIDVFVVARLGDVDVPGEEIRGVHWRDRADTSQRHIILSAISRPLVLAHELGHFFGLPHGSHPRSIMNKKPRERPPVEERGFVAAEQATMQRERDEMLGSGRLVSRAARG